MNKEVIQIISANRWEAAFDDGKGSRIPLVAWALVKTADGSIRINGIIPAKYHQMQCCEDIDEFLCYVPEGIPIDGHSKG